MKILIAGGAGSLGINLANFLSESHKIIIIDNFSSNVVSKEFIKNFKFYDLDISNYSKLKKIFDTEKPEIVINSAASYSDPNNWNRDISTNLLGTVNLLKLSESVDLHKFIYFQTTNCYGDTEKKILSENDPNFPSNSYAISKVAGEDYLKNSSINCISLRLCTIYGPFHFNGPIPIFYNNLINSKTSKIVKSKRNFLHMSDFLKLIELVISKDIGSSHIFNVSSNQLINIEDIYHNISRILKIKKSKYNIIGKPDEDIKSVNLSIKKISKFYNWKPQISFEKGLEMQIQWYENNDFLIQKSHLKI